MLKNIRNFGLLSAILALVACAQAHASDLRQADGPELEEMFPSPDFEADAVVTVSPNCANLGKQFAMIKATTTIDLRQVAPSRLQDILSPRRGAQHADFLAGKYFLATVVGANDEAGTIKVDLVARLPQDVTAEERAPLAAELAAKLEKIGKHKGVGKTFDCPVNLFTTHPGVISTN